MKKNISDLKKITKISHDKPVNLSFKSLSRYGKAGFIILLIFCSSFVFLLLSPQIENLIAKQIDKNYYLEAQERIDDIRKGNIRIQFKYSNGTPVSALDVEFNQTQHEFLFGAMFFNAYRFTLDKWFPYAANESFNSLFSDVFNLALLPFYWNAWDSPDNFTNEVRVNQTIQYCHEHNITMKAHPLLWNYDPVVPEWLDVNSLNDEALMQVFQERVTQEITKYKDNITYWDVTNEVIHRGFFDLPVMESVKDAFTWARDANPDAQLIFNDYSMMGHDFGNGDCARFMGEMNDNDVPYDIIGMQSHSMDTDWVPTYEIWDTLEGFSKFGKSIHITELFVPSSAVPITNSWKKGLWSESAQADYIERFYTMCFSHPSVDAICWWNFRDSGAGWDEDSEEYGLINNEFEPKKAYKTLDRLINSEWHTNGTLQTDTDGYVEFNGFFGQYDILYNNDYSNIQTKSSGQNNFTIIVD